MKQALVLIDIQQDYFPGGAMELVDSEAAVGMAAMLLQTARAHQLPIVHIRHVATRKGATFFLPDTFGAESHPLVAPQPAEAVFTKHYPNSFRETGLLAHLQGLGITSLLIAGMMTHMCIDTTVRAAVDLGFACTLAQDACATRDLVFAGQTIPAGQVQTAFLAALNGLFAKINTAQAICASLDAT